jgi:hypothetical protein
MARSSRRLFAAIGAILPGAILACNGIIGLSDFDKTDCPGATATCKGVGEGGTEGGSEGGPDSGDASSDVAKGADPSTWARWEMPNYKADASVRTPVTLPYMVYTPQGMIQDAGVVQDDKTKLVWVVQPRGVGAFGTEVTFTDAQTQCQALGADWRLPKRIELVSLLSYGRASGDTAPFIDNGTFPNVGGKVWTSSPLRPVNGGPSQQYWIVDFDVGAVATRPGNQPPGARVLCVRGK